MSVKKSWIAISKEVEQITDRLGMSVDEGIKPAVVGLRYHGFGTTGSCEGHVSHGFAAPWVALGDQPSRELIQQVRKLDVPIQKIFEQIPELAKLKQTGLNEQLRLSDLLSEFYAKRNVVFDERMIITSQGIYGAFWLEFQGQNMQEIRSNEEKQSKLVIYQNESHLFADFLKARSVS